MKIAGTAWRRTGWVSLPLTGTLVVLASAWLQRTVGASSAVPDLMPALVYYGHPAWSLRLSTAIIVTMGLWLAALGTLALFASRRHRFVVLWVVTVAAAMVTTAIDAAGNLAFYLTLGARPLQWLGVITAPALGNAFLWGLCWGWLPALITARLDPVLPVASRRRIPARAAVPALLLAGSLLASGSLFRAASGMSASAAGKDPIEPMVAPTAPTPKPTNPPANANPVPDEAFPGRCEHTVIYLSYVFTDASLGSRTAEVHATNQSSEPCRLRGRPDLAFADTNGDEVGVHLVREGAGATVLLKPGVTAVARLSWRADAGANDLAVESLRMGAYRGAPRIVAAAALDVRNGSELHVLGWKLQ